MQMADGGRRLVSQRTRMVRNTVPHRNLDRRKGGERTRVDCGLWRLLPNLVPLCLSHAGREVRCAAQCRAWHWHWHSHLPVAAFFSGSLNFTPVPHCSYSVLLCPAVYHHNNLSSCLLCVLPCSLLRRASLFNPPLPEGIPSANQLTYTTSPRIRLCDTLLVIQPLNPLQSSISTS